MERFLRSVVLMVFVGAIAFLYQDTFRNLYGTLTARFFPCVQPITYDIDKFDSRFPVSQKEFVSALAEAEAVWEKAIGKELFSRVALDPEVKVSLIYDHRQEATDKLTELGLAVDESKGTYDSLLAKLTILRRHYLEDKTLLTSKITLYKEKLSAYNADVVMWNRKKGGSPDEYARLNSENDALDAAFAEIEKLEDTVNAEVDTMNALVVTLNRLAASLNLRVNEYNDVGSSRGEEFEEGTYTTGPDGKTIDIYQFDDRAKLLRVLAHEFGHALGLDHVDDETAIMYRLNAGTNATLSAVDIAQLRKHCGIK